MYTRIILINHMKTANKTLTEQARHSLKGNWKIVITAFVVSGLVTLVARVIPLINLIVPILIAGPIALGLSGFSLNIARGKTLQIKQIFSGFDIFGTALATYLLSILFTILWTLLLIVPGIIAAFSYSQIFFILADDPKTTPMEAITKSKKMMYGNKWKLFCLGLRFVGWGILCIFTLGIGLLWLIPYVFVSYAKFYEDVKHHHVKKDEPVMA
jgi:uncharacterized membrane protein